MKWPFVRRSKHDNLQNQVNCLNKIYSEYAQLNHDSLVEINRLNQELASEMNSHRETKEQLDFERDYTKKVEKELEETKDALKIAQEDLKNAVLCIGEQNTQLEIWKKRSNFYSGNCTEAKESISKVRGALRQIAKKL